MAPSGRSAAVDLLADDGDRLLVDLGCVPPLDGGEIRLARLVAGAGDPAMALEESGGRGQGIGLVVEVDGAVAVAIRAVEQDVLGQELGVPDLAMHRPDGRGRDR